MSFDMKKRLAALLLSSVVTIGLIAGCGSAESENSTGSATSAAQNAATKVVLGYTGTNTPYALVDNYYQIVQENFGDDVTVSYERFESGADGITALVNGDVDIYFGISDLPVVTSGANGSEYELISYYESADTYFSAAPGSGIESMKDVAGKKIGVSLGTMSQYVLTNKLAENGLSMDDVQVVNLSPTDVVTAFGTGEIDVMVDHFILTQALLDSGEAVKFDESDPSLMWTLVNKDFAAANPETVARVLAYYEDVIAYVAENEDAIVPELAEYYEQEEDTFRTTLDKSDTTLLHEITDEDIQELQDVLQFAQDNDLVDGSYDIAPYINNSYVQEAEALAAQ